MTKKAYIFNFDRDDNLNYQVIHDKIISLPEIINWSHYLKTSYIFISSAESATTLSSKLKGIIPSKRFLIVEIKLSNRNGWLPPGAWEWIRRHAN